jgi:hypothetical protein
MRVMRLEIPGEFEDAWVYKDHLLAWTTTGRLLAGPLEQVVRAADTTSTDVGTVLSLLLFRNDWKASALFRRLVQVERVQRELDKVIGAIADEDLTFDPDEVFVDESDDLLDGTLMHANVYADRLYLSTTGGLFDANLGWDAGELVLPENARQRLDRRTVSSTIGYGLINVSCEERGLFTSFDEFGWGGWNGTSSLERTDDVSFGTSWLGTSLLNYRGDDVRLLQGETEEVDGANSRRERQRLIVEYGERRDLLDVVVSDLAAWSRRNKVPAPEELRLVANLGAKFVVEADEKTLLIQLVGAWEPDPTVRAVKELPTAGESVLSAARLAGGIVLESESSVMLWHDDGITELLALPAIRVRTFPNSIRYRDMAIVVSEGAIHLIGVYAPEIELPRNRRTRPRRGVD